MKIGLYIAQILYRTGGTECYSIKLAQCLQFLFPESCIYFVTECFDKRDIVSDASFAKKQNDLYGANLDINRIKLLPIKCNFTNPISSRISYYKIQNSSHVFDKFFYCSVGNFVFKAKQNYAIIHFPAKKIQDAKKANGKFDISFLTRCKDRQYATCYESYLCNSKFTEEWTCKYWPDINRKKIKTLYHPVLPIEKTNDAKTKTILCCSRIDKEKALDVMIKTFCANEYLNTNYTLRIAGSVVREYEEYFESLKIIAEGKNVEFYPSVSRKKLAELYNQAEFFWHAKGFYQDENTDPYKMEHFGMSTVEAMSAGCIPMVINKAGQKEIVKPEFGIKWDTLKQLESETERIAKDNALLVKMGQLAREESLKYSFDEFVENMRKEIM